jgi:hypothetical protein
VDRNKIQGWETVLGSKGKLVKPKGIIVGGVAGDASCAARLRRLDEQVEVLLYGHNL